MKAIAIPAASVFVRDGTACTSSRNVAAAFAKTHRNVVRAIDSLIEQEPSLLGAQFWLSNFSQGYSGARHRAYDMNRDGFSLLAMGFTGPKALKWKLSYIDAFNTMEAGLLASGDHTGIVTGFSQDAKRIFGGVSKAVFRSELKEVLGETLPALIQPMIEAAAIERLVEERLAIIAGVSSLYVLELCGHIKGHRPRGASQFVSRRLLKYHHEHGVRAYRSGGETGIHLFDEITSRSWMKEGGKAAVDQYILERLGQRRLPLPPTTHA